MYETGGLIDWREFGALQDINYKLLNREKKALNACIIC